MACGLTINTKMTYRGDASEEYSNTYWFTGSTPANATAWRALFDALAAQQKTLIPNDCYIQGGYGYDSDADGADSIWSVDLTIAPNTPVQGTFVPLSGDYRLPGDAAVWVRWGTSRFNSGKRIYLRKYFHPAHSKGLGFSDVVSTFLTTKLTDFGGKMRDGTFLDGRTLTARGHTDVLVGSGTSPYVTTRTLKRRGKRAVT